MAVRILQLHKRASYEYRYIQDRYAFSAENQCFALADGTTQSFHSEIWADLLTRSFVRQPAFDTRELIASFTEAAVNFRTRQFSFSTNPAVASLERSKLKKGATATFIGIKVNDDHTVSVTGSGDSNLFILREGELTGFPFSSVEELDRNSVFLNTGQLAENEVNESFFVKATLPVRKGDTIILATDALSRLLLRAPRNCREVLSIRNFDDLHSFCIRHWTDTSLEEDDITAIIIEDFQSRSVNEICPPDGFSFPREEEPEFVPAAFPSIIDEQLNEQEMQYLNNSINHLGNEIDHLKKKGKSQEVLMLIAIGLIVINLLLFFYTQTGRPDHRSTSGEEELVQLKQKHDRQVDDLQGEIDSLKQQLEEEKSKVAAAKKSESHTDSDSKDQQEPKIKKVGRQPPQTVSGIKNTTKESRSATTKVKN